MDSWAATIDHIGWLQLGKPVQPQAGGLGLAVAELPRLDNLIRLAVLGGHDAYRVLNGKRSETSFVPMHELHEEVDAFLLSAISTLLGEPPGPA